MEDMEQYKKVVKENIEELINNNALEEAKKIIKEYEVLVSKDVDIYSFKGVIAMMEGDMDEAERVFNEGLLIDYYNFDLFYNLGYLYENKCDFMKAKYCYYNAFNYSKNDYKINISDKIKFLTEKINQLPLISVIVLAYNNLEYTKLCIESIFQNVSQFNFELITVNNGSNDGTKEYFHSLPKHKIINFKENMGISKGFNEALNNVEGKYILYVSNDIVLTKKSIDNLLRISNLENKFGMIVPACNFSSNYQQVNLEYNNIQQMRNTAELYNNYNNIYYEKMRLIPYVFFTHTSLMKELGGLGEEYGYGGFDDDDISFRIRRKGYKLIFAKGTFVHHFGSKTSSKVINIDMLSENRNKFINKFGIDSWSGTKINWSVVNYIDYNRKKNDHIKILGIDCLIGADLLEIKNKYTDNNVFVEIYSLSRDEKHICDLQSISNTNLYYDINDAVKNYNKNEFEYIILEKNFNNFEILTKYIDALLRILKNNGSLIFYVDINFIKNSKIDISFIVNSIKNKYNELVNIEYIAEENINSKNEYGQNNSNSETMRYIFKISKIASVEKIEIKIDRKLEIEDLKKIACISFYGRSGSVFLQSLLDSHPNILMLPGLYLMDYGAFWNNLNSNMKKENIIDTFCQKYEYIFDTKKRYDAPKEEPWNDLAYYCRYDEMGDNQNEIININQKVFMTELYRCLDKLNIITRRDFFKAIQIAYFYACNRKYKFDDEPLIVYPMHTSLVSKTTHQWALEDFPDAKILYTVREPISNLGSAIKYQINFHMFRYNSPSFLFYSLGMLTGPVSLYENFNFDNIVAVRLEDLHLNSEETLNKLCAFLKIKWNSSLLESTFNGLKWWNFRDTLKVNGFNKSIVNRNYDEFFTNFDRFRIENLLRDIYENWDYGEKYFENDKMIAELIKYPFKFEKKINYDNEEEKSITRTQLTKLLNEFLEKRELIGQYIRKINLLK